MQGVLSALPVPFFPPDTKPWWQVDNGQGLGLNDRPASTWGGFLMRLP